MVKVDAEKAAKIGHLLFRYMRARHRFNEKTDRPLPAHELAALIGLGKTEFDDIYIEPDANPPIVFDGRADDVFEAIIKTATDRPVARPAPRCPSAPCCFRRRGPAPAD